MTAAGSQANIALPLDDVFPKEIDFELKNLFTPK